jgi:hypothetical protein
VGRWGAPGLQGGDGKLLNSLKRSVATHVLQGVTGRHNRRQKACLDRADAGESSDSPSPVLLDSLATFGPSASGFTVQNLS